MSWMGRSRSNCLIFAWRKFRQDGGYFVMRKSRKGWWWHFLWIPSLVGVSVEHFVPIHPWRRATQSLFFRGFLKTNDDAASYEMDKR